MDFLFEIILFWFAQSDCVTYNQIVYHNQSHNPKPGGDSFYSTTNLDHCHIFNFFYIVWHVTDLHTQSDLRSKNFELNILQRCNFLPKFHVTKSVKTRLQSSNVSVAPVPASRLFLYNLCHLICSNNKHTHTENLYETVFSWFENYQNYFQQHQMKKPGL